MLASRNLLFLKADVMKQKLLPVVFHLSAILAIDHRIGQRYICTEVTSRREELRLPGKILVK